MSVVLRLVKFGHHAHLKTEIDFVEILAAVDVVAAVVVENDVVAVANSLVVGVPWTLH